MAEATEDKVERENQFTALVEMQNDAFSRYVEGFRFHEKRELKRKIPSNLPVRQKTRKW